VSGTDPVNDPRREPNPVNERPHDPPSAPPSEPRLAYLDWLRGLAVLVMVLAHVADSWTRADDRDRSLYTGVLFVGGLGAPLFLFLAGVAVALAGRARTASLGTEAAAARALVSRGVEVFVLGLIFRLQSQLLGWGPLPNLLKVDILNIMGVSMIAAAVIWRAGRTRNGRIIGFALATFVATMATPIVRSIPQLAILPDPLEAYLRPGSRYAAFTLFPWAGFLLAGGLTGELIVAARTPLAERRLQWWLAGAGLGGMLAAWWASYRPALYPNASFWTSSPTFFFIRLGIITAIVPAAWAHCRRWLQPEDRRQAGPAIRSVPGRAVVAITQALVTLGRSSLFVYWIHVEMVYGVLAEPIKRTLPLEMSLVATVLLSSFLYVVTRLKNRWMEGVQLPRPMRIFASVLR
jgi:uncharacterized membrane protein